MGTSSALVQQFANIDAQAEQLTGFDQQYEQVDSGRYEGAFFAVEDNDASIFIETTNRTLVQRGAGPDGRLSAIVLLTEGDEPTMCNGVALTSNDVLLVGPGGSYDAVLSRNAIPAVIDVSLDANPLLGQQAGRVAGAVKKVSNDRIATRLRAFSMQSFQTYDQATMQAQVRGTEAQMLMMSLLTAQAATTGSAHRSVLVFRDAYDFMVANLDQSCSIAEVAASVGVSRRGLENAFIQCVGISPARFWRALRLNNTRRLLETGRWGVTEAALASGLRHLGRMAAEYRTQFDELPSVTAERSLVV